MSSSCETFIGLKACRTNLSYFLVLTFPWSVVRFSTACETSRILMEIELFWCNGGRSSNSSLGMVLACLSMRSVGILRGLDSNASLVQWLNWDRRR